MKKRIVILGGGFGGLYTALEIERTIARDPDVDVTLVNHDKFFQGDVERVYLDEKRIEVSHGTDHHHHELEYDHLIIGVGNTTNYYNLPGLEENALTMKSLGDAIFLRNRLIQNMEEADFECTHARTPLMTIVVAGGGFAGVETIAAVNDFLREAIPFYNNLQERDLRIVLVHSGAVILPELSEKLGAYAGSKLTERGVEIRLNTRVLGYRNGIVELSDGSNVATNTLVWTAGTAPHPILDTVPCRKERGRLATNEYMEVLDWPGVWAVGDCASIPDPRTGKPYPPTAQHALRQGRVLARNMCAAIRGGVKKPFIFSTLGQLAAIGKRTGVAQMFGFNFSGFVAWWLWRTIYLSKLPRFEKKCRVALDWSLDLLFSKDLVQFTTVRAPFVQHAEEHKAMEREAQARQRAASTI